MTTFESEFRVRSYELDSFGHANYAVYLNWFEEARWEALREGGFPVDALEERGWAIYVIRAEVDYEKEARLGDRLRIRTRVERYRQTSFVVGQVATRADDPDVVVARSRVVAVWIDAATRRPTRIPDEVRSALGEAEAPAEEDAGGPGGG